MLRTIVVNSKHRISGTTSNYQVQLNDALEPGVEYYKLRLANWFPEGGVTANPSVTTDTVIMKASFNQPFSYDTGRKGSNEVVGLLACQGNLEAVPMIRSFQTIIRAPTFNTLRIWYEIFSNGLPFEVDEHILVFELEPLEK